MAIFKCLNHCHITFSLLQYGLKSQILWTRLRTSEKLNRWLAYTIPIWSETGHSAYPKKQITPNIHTHTMPPNTRVPGSSHQYTHGYCSENQAVCHVRFAYLEEHGYTAHTPPRYIVLNCARSCGYPDVFDKST